MKIDNDLYVFVDVKNGFGTIISENAIVAIEGNTYAIRLREILGWNPFILNDNSESDGAIKEKDEVNDEGKDEKDDGGSENSDDVEEDGTTEDSTMPNEAVQFTKM
ncbi:hypothetical protein L2E82_28004 [Cichorium intybus]|uniref:Uncharacterized protein n=1 Tax=Cichorium intybus TaxID=13427 RepID=A0ACB9CUR2_CICIN|nr:hypothetical protein L2E82_28004 [Cichorium intybus]